MRANWTEADLKAAEIRMGRGGQVGTGRSDKTGGVAPFDQPLTGNVSKQSALQAGSNPAPSPYRSKLEKRWATYLEGLKALQLIDGWHYEPMNVKLPGTRNYYREDFLTWKGRAVTFYQVKGVNQGDDASLVKLKTAAALHPWATWIQVKWVEGAWTERVIQ